HVVHYMHAFLVGEITNEEEQILNEHLKSCEECREIFEELQQTVTLFTSIDVVEAAAGFVSNVNARLPRQTIKKGPKKWFRQHPFMVSAALFLLLMSASFFSSFENEQQLSFT